MVWLLKKEYDLESKKVDEEPQLPWVAIEISKREIDKGLEKHILTFDFMENELKKMSVDVSKVGVNILTITLKNERVNIQIMIAADAVDKLAQFLRQEFEVVRNVVS